MNVFDFVEMAGCACSLLKLGVDDITARFRDFPVCIMDYTDGGMCEKFVDVLFEDKRCAFSISFNDCGLCDMIMLYFGNRVGLFDIVSALNGKYAYDYGNRCWLLGGCFLKLNVRGAKTEFLFYTCDD